MRLVGLSAFPITPSDGEGRIDAEALRRLLAPLVAAEVDSIGLLGSTGTYAYLSRSERRRALTVAVEAVAGRVPLLVGVGALRTDEAVRLAQDAKAAGATAGLLAPVSYTPLTDDEVFEHFVTVARESDLSLVVYDNPGTTHFIFKPALVGRLARVPGIVAVKRPASPADAIAADVAALRETVPAGFSIGYSGDWNAVGSLLAGGEAWYSVAGGIVPRTCMAIVRAARAGAAEEARRLDDALQPLWDLFKAHSSLRVVYEIAALRGICTAQPPKPLLPLPAPARAAVGRVLEQLEGVLLD